MIGTTNSIHLGITVEKLWTNPSPGSAFSAQTVSLDLSEYSYILIHLIHNSDNDYGVNMFFTPVRVGYKETCANKASSTGNMVGRTATVSTTGVTFTTGYNNSTSGTKYAVPCVIYGIRGLPMSD